MRPENGNFERRGAVSQSPLGMTITRAWKAPLSPSVPGGSLASRSRSRRRNLGFVSVLCALVLLACGRPATEEECREILRAAAELELRERIEDTPELIAQELASIEESMKGPMMDKCVGKRITEKSLACVRSAKTSDELFGECLR